MRRRDKTVRIGRRTPLIASLVLFSACEQVEQVQDRFRDMTPHEAYAARLIDAGLAESALARDWVAASRNAIEVAIPVPLPFSEEGFITAEAPGAIAYRINVPRGKKLTATILVEGEDAARVFVDLFRVPASESDPLRPVLSTDSLPQSFVHEPWRGGDFVLRLQPELLRGGRFQVELTLDAQLAFPVEGHGMRAVQSPFGVARDGGRRSHAGVDIFARRGTPVVATSSGVVNRVDVTNLGGKVVWLRDPVRQANLYYAHLDSQHVADGQRVEVGDTLGFVGNTGNARTTPPHLHFGIYRRGEGAVDPAPFLRMPEGDLAPLTADVGRLGRWVRMSGEGIRLREAPGGRTSVLRELERHTPLRVLGGSGAYFRVRLPDGVEGYVTARLTEDADLPVSSRVVTDAQPIRTRPTTAAPSMSELDGGTEVPVLGRFEGFLYVESPAGPRGWVAEQDEAPGDRRD